MNEETALLRSRLYDQAALAVQELRGQQRLGGPDFLFRIDNHVEAAQAPFQFDAANCIVHRQGCGAIPASARSALYGFWKIGPEEQKLACKRCRPVPDDQQQAEDSERTDLLYGLISVVDQFAGVLKERGKDYQNTTGGQELGTRLGTFYEQLGRREKEVLDIVLRSLEELVDRVQDLDEGLKSARRHDDPQD
jgi:hypothetical protein